MPKLSLSVYLNAYSDAFPSNQPGQNNFKWARDLNSILVNNPTQIAARVAPGETLSLFSGMRTLAQDNTTQYSIALAPFQTSIYALTAVAGTLPNFRTPRTTGADATTQVNVSVNGPVVTFTSSPGVAASFMGIVPGMNSSVTITANTLGTVGNSAVLVGDGTSTISTLIANWNTANPSNQISLTAGNGAQIPSAATFASYTGTIPGTLSPVTITANNSGPTGNSVVLIPDGTSTISALISAWNAANLSNQISIQKASFTGMVAGMSTPVTLTAVSAGLAGNSISLTGSGGDSVSTLVSNWNTANPSNQVALTSGDGTQIPSLDAVMSLSGASDGTQMPNDARGIEAHYTGIPAGCSTSVTITADAVGTNGNGIQLIGDGVLSISTLLANYNIANPSNTASLTSGNGGQIPTFGTFITLTGGMNTVPVDLSGGVSSNLQLAGGVTSTPFNLIVGGVVVGDQVTIGNVFNPLNQGTFTVIAVTATSFSVEIISGTNEGPIALGASFASQVSICSAAGVQIGDTLVISGGFTAPILGSYEITAVSAESVQFSSTSLLPAEGPITTEAITIYSNAKSLVYIESDSTLDMILNTVDIGQIEPFMISNANLPSLPLTAIPGIFMLKSTIYSLAVTNNGINPANITFLAVE